MPNLANNFACLFMIPFMLCCRLIHLPEKQYRLIEEIVFHWVNRDYDYDLYYDIEVGMTQSTEPVEVSMSIYKCEECDRIVNKESNKGHCYWCKQYV